MISSCSSLVSQDQISECTVFCAIFFKKAAVLKVTNDFCWWLVQATKVMWWCLAKAALNNFRSGLMEILHVFCIQVMPRASRTRPSLGLAPWVMDATGWLMEDKSYQPLRCPKNLGMRACFRRWARPSRWKHRKGPNPNVPRPTMECLEILTEWVFASPGAGEMWPGKSFQPDIHKHDCRTSSRRKESVSFWVVSFSKLHCFQTSEKINRFHLFEDSWRLPQMYPSVPFIYFRTFEMDEKAHESLE